MPTSTVLRFLAASTSPLLLAAYATAGNAAGLVEGAPGLIGDQTALGTYRPAFSITLQKAAGDDLAGLRARGFGIALEDTLAARAEDKPLFVDYPKPVSSNMLRVIAVVPPKGYELLPIPVCAEQNNKVLATWNITAKGQVAPVAWSGPSVSENPNSSACKAFIMAARAEIVRIAAGQQQNDPQASIPSNADKVSTNPPPAAAKPETP